MRVVAAIPVALVLVASSAFADAQQHIQAAKKAERRGEWSKSLEEWKAAYSQDPNAEYLIGIGDAYAKLGNKDEAKKNYEAYLADPLALPVNVEKVKGKISELDSALALPGLGLPPPSGPGLTLPGAPPPLPLEASNDKKKKGKKGDVAPPPLPGLDLPPPPAAEAKKNDALALPGLDLPGAAPAPTPKKVASAAPTLDLPGAPPSKKEEKVASLDLPPPPFPPPPAASHPKETKPPPAAAPKVATATPPPKPERRPVPDAAVATTQATPGASSSGATRVVAWVSAGVAVVALGGGALAASKVGSAHSDVTGSTHSGVEAQQFLETENKNRTLSYIGFAGGLLAAGIATALFAF
jgi:hypothetical protein